MNWLKLEKDAGAEPCFTNSSFVGSSDFLVPLHSDVNTYKLKENLVRNTTSSEQMVYSAIETTCFGLCWPSSGFYNIEEESINAVKTVREVVD